MVKRGTSFMICKKKKLFVSRDVVFKEHVFPFLTAGKSHDKLKQDFNALPLTSHPIMTHDDEHDNSMEEAHDLHTDITITEHEDSGEAHDTNIGSETTELATPP